MSSYTTIDLANQLRAVHGMHGALADIVVTNAKFHEATKFAQLIAALPSPAYSNGGIQDFVERLPAASSAAVTTFTPSYAGTDAHVYAAQYLTAYFDSPAKLIRCTEPTELLLSVRSMCDGIFAKLYTDSRRRAVAQEAVMDVYERVPFPSDGGSLDAHMALVANYLWGVYEPKSLYKTQWTQELRSAVYAAYYPFFVFLFIMSFVQLSDDTKPNARSNTSFAENRAARLCCYLFVMRMVLMLYDRIPAANAGDAATAAESRDMRNFLAQVIDNISLNVLDRENYDIEANTDGHMRVVSVMSESNRELSSDLAGLSERYDLYRQNLTSAASSEQMLQRQLGAARAWFRFNMWLWIALVVVLLLVLLVPSDIARGYDTKIGYALCACGALYALVVALVGAVRAL